MWYQVLVIGGEEDHLSQLPELLRAAASSSQMASWSLRQASPSIHLLPMK
jgi:hypothetical protein